VSKITDIFPNASHVMLKHLDESTDLEVWKYARKNGYTIVTKDSDFNELAISRGSPPKIIWIKIGNCRVNDIVQLLKENHHGMIEFLEDEFSAIFEI